MSGTGTEVRPLGIFSSPYELTEPPAAGFHLVKRFHEAATSFLPPYPFRGDIMNETDQQTAGWQLEQSGPEAYERYLVPPMFAPWAERLVDRSQLRADDRVLDVGCGTGIVARRAAARVGDGGAVVGLDVNGRMLDVAG